MSDRFVAKIDSLLWYCCGLNRRADDCGPAILEERCAACEPNFARKVGRVVNLAALTVSYLMLP